MDFAAVLWGLTGFAPTVPKNGWRKMGVCVGPQRTAIWRLFDAQWFGVPQRRRRIFIVAGPANLCTPEILFEPESLLGNTPTRPQQTENTPTPTNGSITNNDQQTASYWDGGQIADTVDVSMAVKGQMLPEKRRMFAVIEPYVKSSRARSSDGYETWVEGEVNPTLNVFDMGDTRATTVIASFDSTWSGAYPMYNGDVSPPVKVGSTLGIASPPAIATDLTVRRLTPIECERLMGWPDNWTATGSNGPLSDSQRYKLCGNGVVAPITKWIGQRLP
jgi:DNA (cytosine-5)-methyltransferase 1